METTIQRIRNIFEPVIGINGEEYCDMPSKQWDKVPSTVDQVEEAIIIEDTPSEAPSKRMIHITDAVYRQIAEQVREKINDSGDSYLSGLECEVDDEETTYQLFLSAQIYYRPFSAPDGKWDEVSDIVPVWWELHTFYGADQEEYLNDARFDQLKKHLL